MPEVMSDVDKIIAVLNEVDLEDNCHQPWPCGTVNEYKPEALILLRRVVNQPLTAEYVRDVWLVMFATHDTREHSRISPLGRHGVEHSVWIGDMPMREGFRTIADRVNDLFPQGSKSRTYVPVRWQK